METIGKYRIIGALGEGGFGHVYKAEDPAIGNIVAIKVLNVQNDENMLRRFRAEAVTSAKLRHKNIVTIFDFEQQNGVPYLVMEYLDGRNLQPLVANREAAPAINRLSIMSEVAEGLHYAHEQGVIHRDIKPANIMWLRDGSVKIMDFGIARLTQRTTSLTAVGYMVGTPEYMAPEQFMGGAVDLQVDVWAYGVVLYELLTGRNPFAADALGVMMYKVTNEDPRPICEQAPDLPRSLDPILRRLLAKKKTDRYASMDDVRMDLGMVIQEFGEAQVAGMERDAESLIAAGRYDEALGVAAAILKFDHRNARAREWRAEIRNLMRRQKAESQIKTLIEEADQKVTMQDFQTAESRLQEILQIDPENGAARSRLTQINEEREKKARGQRLLAEARAEWERQNLAAAFARASEAAQHDPANPEASQFLNQVRTAIDQQNAARRESGLNRARGQLLVQDYAGAVLTLQRLDGQFPNDSEIALRIAEAERLQAAAADKTVAATLAQSRECLSRGAIEEAIELLSRLEGEAARNTQVVQLLSFARNQRDEAVLANRQRAGQANSIDGELRECRGLMDEGRFEQAETRARELWKRSPDHSGVQAIIRELGERLRQSPRFTREQDPQTLTAGRTEAYLEGRREVLELMKNHCFDDAIVRLRKLAAVFPDVPQVENDLRRAIAHRDEVARKAAIAKERESLQGLVKSSEFEQAVYKTQELLAIFPQEPELVDLLDRARQARDRAARKEAYARRRRDFEELMQNGDFDGAITALERLAADFPEQPEIMEDLRRTLAARDQARQKKTFSQGGDLV